MRQKASCVRLIIYSNEVIYINVQEVLVEMFQTRMNMRKVDVQCWQTSNNSNQSCELKKYMNMNCFKGRVSHFFFILAQVPLGIIYDGKIVETGRSDLETVQKCKNSVFLGPRIWHSNCGGCPKFGTETAGGVLNSALKLRGCPENSSV